MRRSLALLVSLIIIAGCSKPTPAPAPPLPLPEPPVHTIPTPETGKSPAPVPEVLPPPVRQDLPITAIYHDIAAGYGKKPDVPAFNNACIPSSSNAALTGQITALDWAPYPGLTPKLWVPVVTFDLCNPGALLVTGTIKVASQGAFAFEDEERLKLPRLAPGAGTGSLAVYLPIGLPDGLMRLIEQRALPWPEVTVNLSHQATYDGPFREIAERSLTVPTGQTGASTAQWRLPDQPSLELLRAADWTGRRMRIGPDGPELFLYSPEMRFQVIDLIGCNPPGGLGALSTDWGLWSRHGEGDPRREGSLGDWVFQGSYRWSIEERPAVGSTFILLNFPSQCHFPGGAAFWHYDPTTGALVRPTITIGANDRPASAPSPVIEADGDLYTYDLRIVGEESPWIKVTYQWDPLRHNWSLPGGPSGAPGKPADVYSVRP